MEARDLILEADRISKSQGLSQSKWSALSGHAENGQTAERTASGKLGGRGVLLLVIGTKLASRAWFNKYYLAVFMTAK